MRRDQQDSAPAWPSAGRAAKRGLAACAAAVLALSAVSCSAGSDSGAIILKFAHDSPPTSPYQAAAETFKEQVEQGTNGRVEVKIFPSAQLGEEDVVINGLQSGAVDATIVNVPSLEPTVKELQLFFMPFLFQNEDQALRVTEGPVGERMEQAISQKVGAETLGWGSIGEAVLANTVRAVSSPADMHGLKIRTSTSSIATDTYKALGALPTQLAFGEVYQGLQSGIVDGLDSGSVDLVDMKFYQVLNHVTLLRQFVRLAPVLVSQNALDKVSAEDQQIIRDAGKAAAEAELAEDKSQSEEALKTLPDNGVQVTELTDEQRQVFIDAVAPVYDQYAEAVGGRDLIEQVRQTS
ncbi:ABC transporter substrate-binding protein [Mycolicibacterium murale]|uniref:ABC transporter substrate-binding protein n=1 Tax=Mycolicibacterium murale TaxID=182220 RepID=A0A7I9WN00_9MYCO|nr:TRAP transporter substrate-binding protein [Mycolicibacterium murale]MCV7180421.1 TRAP transporter substrate-binding protein [Mycolicibacterium murale]GFG58710.1 ABC transporter substrate-binding protein [Mycolicibacterium murale]